jgi:tricorn protease
VDIKVVTDRATLRPRQENVAKLVQGGSISPTGKRAVFEARGDLFTVPAEDGIVRNLTRSTGVAERYPNWSPDAKWVAYFTDRSGEYELALLPADGSGEEEILTKLGAGYRFTPQWSPDSQKLVFIDKAMKVQLFDRKTKAVTELYQQLWMYHGALRGFTVSWSADSRWIAFAGEQENRHSAIILYDTKEQKRHQVTRGYFDDDQPTFDPAGKYLYFRTGRTLEPVYGDLDDTWVYPNTRRLAVVPLRKDVPSPLAPKNDEEPAKKEDAKSAEPKKDEPAKEEPKKESSKNAIQRNDIAVVSTGEAVIAQKAAPKKKSGRNKAAPKSASATTNAPVSTNATAAASSTNAPKPLEIDIEGFEARAILLPTKHGNYDDLQAGNGRLFFRRLPRTGSDGGASTIEMFDLQDRKAKRVLDDASGFMISANKQKLLVARKGDWFIIDAKENQAATKKLNLGDMEMLVDPAQEWRQIFTDAWRLQRDFFYDPGLHGVNWTAMRARYGKLLDDAVTRWDVNLLIGELISELNASHTYLQGRGDVEETPTRGVGYLGCDFKLENGAYRIAKIVTGAPWDTDEPSPLAAPGLKVKEGDYLLAVNGIPLDTTREPWAAFQDKAGETVALSINDKPELKGAREVLVVTLKEEMPLRYRAWIEENRQRVEQLSNGQVGYVYVPSTAVEGQNDLVRQWRAQFHLPGLVIDERFNSGGQIPNRFVELLNRPLNNFWGVRDGKDWQWPPVAHAGPQAMLINGWSGSGGDCFPYYFKQRKLGPLIGMRTWGGLIGITGAPPLIDGGTITVPTFGIFDQKGKWIIEGYGVDPDIEVVDDPALMAKGKDPQLERGVAEVLKALKKNPVNGVEKPKYPDRSGF